MQLNDPILIACYAVVAALFGLVMGSFVNCWAWRSVHGESVVHGRSHCPACGHDLGARDLVPVVSWLASGGACRYCGKRISVRYPVTEVVCAAVFAAIVATHGATLESLELMAFSGVLLFLSLTDLDEFVIPNGCIVAALAIRAAYMLASWALGAMTLADIGYYVISAIGVGVALLLVVLLADRLFGRESMGGGDLKLYFVAALYFGWQQSIFLVIASCVIGILVALLSPRFAGDSQDGPEDEGVLKRVIPFGPSIAAACVVVMLVGDPVATWYLGLL